MKLKVCGMKNRENITEVARLGPDYLGFIFYEKSPRYFEGDMPELPNNIKKVGVFVDSTTEEIFEKVSTYNLDAIQLHGNESAQYCKNLQVNAKDLQIIKVFSVDEDFNFNSLKEFEDCCDYFLFDTKGKLPGGNGYTFNWDILKEYPSIKPYFLSGGIGLDSLDAIKEFLGHDSSKYCHAIDVNSKFESEPGQKIISQIQKFKNELTHEL
ncbi:phosphoribosylanthranilate isomerase [Flavobacteriaceae bacterium MAR_2010_188]|nr:phosphoribosylanthranilate isomerase [Flavobacteriaceae bacterium MAR_2010_188]